MGANTGERATGAEAGFTLAELLVVMLVIGILAAVATPAFFHQTDKAQDSQAKQATATAHTAMEVIARTEGGDYTGITADDLIAEEETLRGAVLSEPIVTADSFTARPRRRPQHLQHHPHHVRRTRLRVRSARPGQLSRGRQLGQLVLWPL